MTAHIVKILATVCFVAGITGLALDAQIARFEARHNMTNLRRCNLPVEARWDPMLNGGLGGVFDNRECTPDDTQRDSYENIQFLLFLIMFLSGGGALVVAVNRHMRKVAPPKRTPSFVD